MSTNHDTSINHMHCHLEGPLEMLLSCGELG
jgi:hypothetical protein